MDQIESEVGSLGSCANGGVNPMCPVNPYMRQLVCLSARCTSLSQLPTKGAYGPDLNVNNRVLGKSPSDFRNHFDFRE